MQTVPYRFLDDPAQIAACLEGLRSERVLALDFEADSLHSYREKLCLAQVSTIQANAVLDALAGRSALEGLGTILGDPSVEKVFHGGDYDVRLLKKSYGFEVRNLFDTMIAAQFTGRTKVGLAALLEEHFGVHLDKKHQRADWSVRPLKPQMLAYAALDTAYLLPLKARLEEELKALGRLEWAREEFRLLQEVTPAAPKAPSCFDVKGASRLSPRQLAVLQALLEVREAAARRWDRPGFKVLPNAVLLRWAETPPTSRKAVLEAEGAGRRSLCRLADEVLRAVRRAHTLPREAWPRPKYSTAPAPMDEFQEKRLQRLKRARTRAVERLGLAPGLLVNTATLERLARESPDPSSNGMERHLKHWQLQAVGDDLREALSH